MLTKAERKKNLLRYLRAKYEFGYERDSCYRCIHEEQDELEDGKPFCEIKGSCKHFAHVITALGDGFKGKPLTWIEGGALSIFDEISDKIIGLSSFDGAEMPSVSFYPCAVGVVDMPESDFQTYLMYKLKEFKRSIIRDRVNKIKENHG